MPLLIKLYIVESDCKMSMQTAVTDSDTEGDKRRRCLVEVCANLSVAFQQPEKVR